MKDVHGKEIVVGCEVCSTKFGGEGSKLTCSRVDDDGQVYLKTEGKDPMEWPMPERHYWEITKYPKEKK